MRHLAYCRFVSQLSFFSAEAVPPAVADLTGLLAGPGQVVLVGAGREQGYEAVPALGCGAVGRASSLISKGSGETPNLRNRAVGRTSRLRSPASSLGRVALFFRGQVVSGAGVRGCDGKSAEFLLNKE